MNASEPQYMREDATSFGGSLTEEQVRFYREEGYLVLPNLLTQEEMVPVCEALMARVDEIADDLFRDGLVPHRFVEEPFPTRLARLFDHLTDEDFLKYGRSWRDRHPGYYHFMKNSKILDAVESLIGGEVFSNPVYNSRPKVPGVAAGAVPWHQDRSYWPGANANPVITTWIPLVDATPENGCLHIWPRTHNNPLLDHQPEHYSGTQYHQIDVEKIPQSKKIKEVAVPLAVGGAILFNDRCIHMSTPNNSDHVRWSVDLRYQPTDQDPMPNHGAGFLCRSYQHSERIATVEDWLAMRTEHES